VEDTLNDWELSFFGEHDVPALRLLTDQDAEFLEAWTYFPGVG
jgi:hypothetical protein